MLRLSLARGHAHRVRSSRARQSLVAVVLPRLGMCMLKKIMLLSLCMMKNVEPVRAAVHAGGSAHAARVRERGSRYVSEAA